MIQTEMTEKTLQLFKKKAPENLVNWNEFTSALLIEVKRGNDIFTSSAVAIAPQIILTAAHSVEGVDSAKVFLDSHYNMFSKNFLKVSDIIIHPEYDQRNSNFLNDIAIIILDKPLPSSVMIHEIHHGNLLQGELARIGFGGRFSQNARNFTNPKYIALPCDHRYFMCEDKFSVVGDSGGPVFIRTEEGLKLAGLHSTLEGDKLTYSVKVSSYIKWIQNVLSRSNSLTL